jgi:hypothetical protein
MADVRRPTGAETAEVSAEAREAIAAGHNALARAGCEVAPFDGKDLGVRSTRRIEAGAVLLREPPLLELAPDGAGRFDARYPSAARELARELLGTLSTAKPAGRTALDCAVATNGFVLRPGAPDTRSVTFLTIARFNHSCAPNCAFEWDEARQEGVVAASQPVEPGRELTINYGAGSDSRDERRAYLLERFGFECTCSKCAE